MVSRTGILLTNLGTPAAPETGALRTYLREFLSDPRVVDLPRLLWWPILHGIILNVRPARSAAAYRGVWTEDGSPLLVLRTERHELVNLLATRRGEERPWEVVELGAHYDTVDGSPSVSRR